MIIIDTEAHEKLLQQIEELLIQSHCSAKFIKGLLPIYRTLLGADGQIRPQMLPHDVKLSVAECARYGKMKDTKIQAIKYLRDQTGLDHKEAKEVIEYIFDNFPNHS